MATYLSVDLCALLGHDEFTSVRVKLEMNTNTALGNGTSDTTGKDGSTIMIALSAVAMVVALAVAGLAIYLWFVKRRNRKNGIASSAPTVGCTNPSRRTLPSFLPPTRKLGIRDGGEYCGHSVFGQGSLIVVFQSVL